MSFSNYLENYVLDLIFGQVSYWQPWISVGLSAADPLEDGSGLFEPLHASYSRVITDAADWNYSYFGGIDNAWAIVFDMAMGDWGTITHFALFDEAYYGVMLAYGALSVPVDISAGYIPSFGEGELIVILNGA